MIEAELSASPFLPSHVNTSQSWKVSFFLLLRCFFYFGRAGWGMWEGGGGQGQSKSRRNGKGYVVSTHVLYEPFVDSVDVTRNENHLAAFGTNDGQNMEALGSSHSDAKCKWKTQMCNVQRKNLIKQIEIRNRGSAFSD